MISARDLVYLPYSSDLTAAGIIHAGRRLPRLHAPARRNVYDTIRRDIAATAFQLAFQRYLDRAGVQYRPAKEWGFARPESRAIEIGGRRCELKPFLISRPDQLRALASARALALRADAVIPLERFVAEQLRDEDVYLFALVTAHIEDKGAGPRQGEGEPNSTYWMHAMPRSWMIPALWGPLERLSAKSEGGAPVSLCLSGESASKEVEEEWMNLQAGRSVNVSTSLYSVFQAHLARPSPGRIGLRSRVHPRAHVIKPSDWHNVWIRGEVVCLLGWITRARFQAMARQIPEGSRLFQFSRTKTKNLGVTTSALQPVADLLDRMGGRAS
jgi:hypothetical protein